MTELEDIIKDLKNCTRNSLLNEIQVWYVCVEEKEDVLIVYEDCIFTSYEKCIKLKQLALEEYNRDQVDICSFSLNPRVW